MGEGTAAEQLIILVSRVAEAHRGYTGEWRTVLGRAAKGDLQEETEGTEAKVGNEHSTFNIEHPTTIGES
jgi:hypothetical protein